MGHGLPKNRDNLQLADVLNTTNFEDIHLIHNIFSKL